MLNAVLLPHVVRFNAAADASRFRPLADALGVRGARRLADDEVGDALAARIGDLARSIGAPRTLSGIGVTQDQIEGFARQTLCDACLTTNPREVTEDDVRALLWAAF